MGQSSTRLSDAARRYLVALVLFVAGFLAQGLHSALESHEVCEHGELVHVETGAAHAGHGEHGASDALEPEPCEGPTVDAAEEHEDTHHHCGIAVAAPLVEPSFSAPLGFVLQLAPIVRVSSSSAPRVERIARLRLAPHTSPPEIQGA